MCSLPRVSYGKLIGSPIWSILVSLQTSCIINVEPNYALIQNMFSMALKGTTCSTSEQLIVPEDIFVQKRTHMSTEASGDVVSAIGYGQLKGLKVHSEMLRLSLV